MLFKNSKTFENKFDEFVMMMADSEKKTSRRQSNRREQKVLTINCKNIGMVASKRDRLNFMFCIGNVKL